MSFAGSLGSIKGLRFKPSGINPSNPHRRQLEVAKGPCRSSTSTSTATVSSSGDASTAAAPSSSSSLSCATSSSSSSSIVSASDRDGATSSGGNGIVVVVAGRGGGSMDGGGGGGSSIDGTTMSASSDVSASSSSSSSSSTTPLADVVVVVTDDDDDYIGDRSGGNGMGGGIEGGSIGGGTIVAHASSSSSSSSSSSRASASDGGTSIVLADILIAEEGDVHRRVEKEEEEEGRIGRLKEGGEGGRRIVVVADGVGHEVALDDASATLAAAMPPHVHRDDIDDVPSTTTTTTMMGGGGGGGGVGTTMTARRIATRRTSFGRGKDWSSSWWTRKSARANKRTGREEGAIVVVCGVGGMGGTRGATTTTPPSLASTPASASSPADGGGDCPRGTTTTTTTTSDDVIATVQMNGTVMDIFPADDAAAGMGGGEDGTTSDGTTSDGTTSGTVHPRASCHGIGVMDGTYPQPEEEGRGEEKEVEKEEEECSVFTEYVPQSSGMGSRVDDHRGDGRNDDNVTVVATTTRRIPFPWMTTKKSNRRAKVVDDDAMQARSGSRWRCVGNVKAVPTSGADGLEISIDSDGMHDLHLLEDVMEEEEEKEEEESSGIEDGFECGLSPKRRGGIGSGGKIVVVNPEGGIESTTTLARAEARAGLLRSTWKLPRRLSLPQRASHGRQTRAPMASTSIIITMGGRSTVEDCAMSRLTVDDVIDHDEDVVARIVDIQEIREVVANPSDKGKFSHPESVEVPWTVRAPVADHSVCLSPLPSLLDLREIKSSERNKEPSMPDSIHIDVASDSESVAVPWTPQASFFRQTSKRSNESSIFLLDAFDSPLWPSKAEAEQDLSVARDHFDIEDKPRMLQVLGSAQPYEVGLLSGPLSDHDSRIETDVIVQLENGPDLIPIDSFLSNDVESFYEGDDQYSAFSDHRPRKLSCLQNIIEEIDDLSLAEDMKRAFDNFGFENGMYKLCTDMPCAPYEDAFADGDTYTFFSRSQSTFSTVETPKHSALSDGRESESHRPRRVKFLAPDK